MDGKLIYNPNADQQIIPLILLIKLLVEKC